MKIVATLALAAAAASSLGTAQASVITFETASSTAGAQANAAAYKSVVDLAMTGTSARSAEASLYSNLSNGSVFGGSNRNIAYRATVDFGVAADQAGTWDFRVGVDFGRGGAVFLDGVAVASKTSAMWWANDYTNLAQSFQLTQAITAGNHQLQIYGLENCCDGRQQAQFRINGGAFTTFGANDGLAAVVPEPSTYALMGLGLAMLVATRRRANSIKTT